MSEMLFTVAPNGARLGKTDHSALPISPEELADCAVACHDAGAAMIHLHVRDDQGKHVLDGDGYREATQAIRRALGDKIVIQVTTEAVGIYKSDAQRALVHDVKPEAVSLGLRELLPVDGDEAEFAQFWNWMVKERIWGQVILYDAEDVRRLVDLRKRGVFGEEHLSVLFVLGRYGKQLAVANDLIPFMNEIESELDLDWSVCAFGKNENACVTAAATMGGHARIGFENNRHLIDGSIARDNAQLVGQAVISAQMVGRSPISAQKLRDLRAIG